MLDVNDLILELAQEVRTENEGNNNWNEVATRLGLRYGIVKTPNACKKTYQRSNKKQGIEPKSKEILEIKPSTFAKFGLDSDGTQTSERMLALSESDMKNPISLMLAHGYNPDLFELLSATNNFWGNQQYQSKIKVKPKTSFSELSREDIVCLVKDIKPIEYEFKLKPLFDEGEELALEINFSDLHIGMLSWGKEVGEDYDYKIAFDNIRRVLEKIERKIYNLPVTKVYLCFLGDFLHIDTEEGTTTKGTKVDTDSRPKLMIIRGNEIVMEIIERLAIVDTEVKWVEGNHSRNIEFAVFNSQPFIFKNYKHIKFDVTPIERKFFVFGENLIGLEHGEINKQNEFNWLQIEARTEWGLTSYAEQHSGHIHHESVKTKGGIVKRSNPAFTGVSKYEFHEGYHSFSRVVGYLWHKEDNLLEQYYFK